MKKQSSSSSLLLGSSSSSSSSFGSWCQKWTKLVAVVSFVALAYTIRSRRAWRMETAALVAQLEWYVAHSAANAAASSPLVDPQRMAELPPVVQTYLIQALVPGHHHLPQQFQFQQNQQQQQQQWIRQDQETNQEDKDDKEEKEDGGVETSNDNSYHDKKKNDWLSSSSSTTTVPWSSVRSIQSVSFHQNGTFRMPNGAWVPFEATQHVSAKSPVGFVWDATMLMPLPLSLEIPVTVRDVFLLGHGRLQAQMGHVIPLMDLQGQQQFHDLDVGEMLRWLAEAVLVPTALLPSEYISWKAVDDDETCALLVMNDTLSSGLVGELVMTFDQDNGLPRSIQGLRPKLSSGNHHGRTLSEWAWWQGTLSDYQLVAGMLIPIRMEAAWKNKDTNQVEPYFRCENTAHDYVFA